jgi:hypothetical protein
MACSSRRGRALVAWAVLGTLAAACGEDGQNGGADPGPGNGLRDGGSAASDASADGATLTDASESQETGGGTEGDGDVVPPFDASNLGDARTLPAPPATWQEHWFEHVQVLKLIDYNDDVAVYYDDDVNRTDAAWQIDFMTKIWHYSRQVYGEMKDAKTDGRLYAIYHQNKYGGGHPSYYYDGSHDFHNVTDCGPGPWVQSDDYAHDEPSHEAGHVVESTNNGRHGSPAFPIWGDSKWMEFYQYDLYSALGMTADAQRVFTRFTNQTDTFPRSGTHWFRDWFYPLWRDHGHAQVLVNFFQLLGQYFPKNNNNDYSRDLNWGEFVHFMSGAAKTNLLSQAHTAFGPDYPKDADFAQAQKTFSQITY